MKKITLVVVLAFLSLTSFSQKFEFDYLSSSLDESILKDYQYIK